MTVFGLLWICVGIILVISIYKYVRDRREKRAYASTSLQRSLFTIVCMITAISSLMVVLSLAPFDMTAHLSKPYRDVAGDGISSLVISYVCLVMIVVYGAIFAGILLPEVIWPYSIEEKSVLNIRRVKWNSKMPKWLHWKLYDI
jgi:protein-S-isoprenylcysteine O-methyltransferase Ste14